MLLIPELLALPIKLSTEHLSLKFFFFFLKKAPLAKLGSNSGRLLVWMPISPGLNTFLSLQ